LAAGQRVARIDAMDSRWRPAAQEVRQWRFAVELIHNKSYFMAVTTRLEVISREDIDSGGSLDCALRPDGHEASAAMVRPDPMKLGRSRLAIGNAIRLMARAQKSREGDHFAATVFLV
jgi:hypothetical protein